MRSNPYSIVRLLAALGLALAGVTPSGAVDVHDTRLLADPAISASHVAFAYAGDLWVANLDGTGVRRLTTDQGTERSPRFSPDGSLIAFSGEYDGNLDVYVVPVEGGVPQRLTWHPGMDLVQGFTPDGSKVLFASPRQVFTDRHTQLFTIPVTGGWAERLPIPHGLRASISPDGGKIAYTPLSERFQQWKNYRGGTHTRIWIYDTGDASVQEIPQPEGRCNDTDPVWIGPKVYFRSDREGEFNLFAFDPGSEDVEQLTFFDDFPVLRVEAGGGRIVLEQAGYLHLYETSSNRPRRLPIGIAADLLETRPRYAKGQEFLRAAELSPSGARLAIELRGEILTVPAEKGDPRNLTGSAGVNERSPVWSPDGTRIAYFSDAGGEYRLHVRAQDGKGQVRTYELGGAQGGAGFYEDPAWSPDGTKISYVDNSWSLFILDLESGATSKVGSEAYYGPIRTLSHSWSPDSRWLAYTLDSAAYIQSVYVYSVSQGTSYPITDGLSEVSEPVFDRSGKYLYFLASTNAGPVKQWFAMSNADMDLTSSLYLAVLRADEPSPLAPQSDEEGAKSEPEAAGSGDESAAPPQVRIDFDGLRQRIVALPVPPAGYTSLGAGEAGKIYYLHRPRITRRLGTSSDPASLRMYDLAKREEQTLLDGVSGYDLSGDGKKVFARTEKGAGIADAATKIDASKGQLALDQIEVHVDPRAEWAQIYEEAWRINRDYFYDPGMHGADWPAMREKYRQFLPDLATRDDLNRVIQWLCSELAVGHHAVFGGDSPFHVEPRPVGLLGADFEVAEGRYRIRKIFGGLNWNPDLRSPLTEPGVNVAVGDVLLAVDGEPLTASDNPFRPFENKAGKMVELTVGRNADGSDARTVTVVPIEDESGLRNRDWVEGNLRRVNEATGGRVAYVYVPNTTVQGHTYFKRYFFPQVDKDAIIVDERFNGGGQVADYYIDHLRRPFIAHWATRYGADIRTPSGAIQGPKVMLIDETAGSGGDLLPWMFHKLELGTLVGKRTWGGLVGTLGFPVLLDGGRVTAPNLAIWTEDGFVVENVGVPPDVEVEQWPAEVEAGRDPQLEKAIEIVLEKLEESPAPVYTRPPYPIRVRR